MNNIDSIIVQLCQLQEDITFKDQMIDLLRSLYARVTEANLEIEGCLQVEKALRLEATKRIEELSEVNKYLEREVEQLKKVGDGEAYDKLFKRYHNACNRIEKLEQELKELRDPWS